MIHGSIDRSFDGLTKSDLQKHKNETIENETIENDAETIENGAETIENSAETIENGAATIENGTETIETVPKRSIWIRLELPGAPKSLALRVEFKC